RCQGGGCPFDEFPAPERITDQDWIVRVKSRSASVAVTYVEDRVNPVPKQEPVVISKGDLYWGRSISIQMDDRSAQVLTLSPDERGDVALTYQGLVNGKLPRFVRFAAAAQKLDDHVSVFNLELADPNCALAVGDTIARAKADIARVESQLLEVPEDLTQKYSE